MLHPLSLFPHLLSYPFLAYFIIRITVALGLLRLANQRRKKTYKNLSIVLYIISIMIFVGYYTQGALLAGIIFMITDVYLDKKSMISDSKESIIVTLLCGISIALLFLGPGLFALDYPL